MNFQTELVGESSCAIETNHDRGSSTWVDFASALAEGPGAARAPDYNSSGFVFMLVAICFTALIVPPARRALILVTTTGPRLVAVYIQSARRVPGTICTFIIKSMISIVWGALLVIGIALLSFFAVLSPPIFTAVTIITAILASSLGVVRSAGFLAYKCFDKGVSLSLSSYGFVPVTFMLSYLSVMIAIVFFAISLLSRH